MDRWMNGWVNGWMDGCMCEWMDGWMEGRMDGQLDERLNTALSSWGTCFKTTKQRSWGKGDTVKDKMEPRAVETQEVNLKTSRKL